LSCSASASFILTRPSSTGGTPVTTIAPIISQPSQNT
jgi:hypothetical protein